MDTATRYETLWCRAGQHEWPRRRMRGGKPHRCPLHGGRTEPYAEPDETPIGTAADMYLAALTVALDRDEDSQARERAGLLMRDLANGMRTGPQLAHNTDTFPCLRAAICAALDHRIFGS